MRTHGPCVPTGQTEKPYASYVLLSRKKNKLTMSTESPYASYVLLSKYPLTYKKIRNKKEKNAIIAQRALDDLAAFLETEKI